MESKRAGSLARTIASMPNPSSQLSSPVIQFFQCAERIPQFDAAGALTQPSGYFKFGEDVVCYGQSSLQTRQVVNGNLIDASNHVDRKEGKIFLPFHLSEVIDNLRFERYTNPSQARRWVEKAWVKDLYYLLRPMFPVAFRKHLQKIYLVDWEKIRFPNWPVDRSVDILFERLLALALKLMEIDRLPFIWFWPDGYQACAIVTHDVETEAGRDFSSRLMDIDDSFGIRASFQLVPEKRYGVPGSYLDEIRQRGFEINVQGLDHDGNLFRNREAFLKAAHTINHYAKQYGARGFRSPILYRNVDWFQDLDFSYDMSVPNVARLEAQRGGCCTVMPYFLPGGVTELPVTATEDYTLFHILKDYSMRLWRQQMRMIMDGHGLISFIVHPDYVMEDRAMGVYQELLAELKTLRGEGVWLALPAEVDGWWRDRSAMKLVPDGRDWKIEGPGSARARVAYVSLDGDRLVYDCPAAEIPVKETFLQSSPGRAFAERSGGHNGKRTQV